MTAGTVGETNNCEESLTSVAVGAEQPARHDPGNLALETLTYCIAEQRH